MKEHLMYTQQSFNNKVLNAIVAKTGFIPTDEECKAVAHHMEYNIRADKNFADNGHLKISTTELRKHIIAQINTNLHANDLPRYVEQYRSYKKLQKYNLLTGKEKQDIADIALGRKKISDYDDKEYLKNIYIKYFNQSLMPKIEKISLQKKNNLQYHGLWHTEQVALLGIDIALRENLNPLPVVLAAGLHDCARTSDKHDPDHGINCKPLAEEFLRTYPDRSLISAEEKTQIIEAVVLHNSPRPPRNNHILDCLQDADCMRLLWSGRQHFTPNTDAGRKLASYSPRQQIKYMAALIEKTRAATPSFYNGGNSLTR